MSIKTKINIIHFEKVSHQHHKIIFEWLAEPHMQEFWDNSQEHKDDIINFMNGRKEPSNYFKAIFNYWIGSVDNQPFCFILTSEMMADQKDITDLHRANLSMMGNTITIDFGIGNKAFLGKGLAASTLKAFVEFFRSQVDPTADTFFIDPDENNPRAKYVYEKAGFNLVGNFDVQHGVFKGSTSYLMVKKLLPNPKIIPATTDDYPTVENMWRFYIYDMGRYCGFNKGWEDPSSLSFVPDDLTNYFVDETRKAFLVNVGNELAGFVFLNKVGRLPDTQWNMSEFFILAKFQGKGIGEQVAHQIFEMYQGLWEVSVIPENKSALAFWRKVVSKFTGGLYLEEVKIVDCRGHKAPRYILSFNTAK